MKRGLIPEGSLANSNSHGDGNALRPWIESGTDSVSRPPSAAATAVRNARRSASRCRCRRWSGSSSTLGKNGSSGAGVGNAPSVMPTMNTRSKARPVTDCTGPIRIPRPRPPTGRARPSSASRNLSANSSTDVPPANSSTSAWRSSASARATSSAKGTSSASQAGVPPHSAVNRRSAHVTNWSHEEPSLGGQELSAEEVALVNETTNRILASCSPEQQHLLLRKLEGVADGDVAREVGVSEASIQRATA